MLVRLMSIGSAAPSASFAPALLAAALREPASAFGLHLFNAIPILEFLGQRSVGPFDNLLPFLKPVEHFHFSVRGNAGSHAPRPRLSCSVDDKHHLGQGFGTLLGSQPRGSLDEGRCVAEALI